MKIPFLSLCLVGALMGIPQHMALAQDSTASGQTTPSTGSTNSGSGQGQQFGRLKGALAQLDLSEAQKEQIKQIRATVTDRKERRHQIIAVLSPGQKAKLREIFQARRNGAQGGAGASSTANEEP